MLIVAYIDPGSGYLIWQAVVAALLGLLFYLKRSRDFLLGMTRKWFSRKSQ
jgi:hypothetical protein